MSHTHQEAPFLHLWAHFTVHLKVDVALQRAQEWHLWPRAGRLNGRLTLHTALCKSHEPLHISLYFTGKIRNDNHSISVHVGEKQWCSLQVNMDMETLCVCVMVTYIGWHNYWVYRCMRMLLPWMQQCEWRQIYMDYELGAFIPSPKETGSSQLKPGWACMLQSEQSYWCEPHWGLQDWPQLQQHTLCLIMTSDTGGKYWTHEKRKVQKGMDTPPDICQ